MIFSISNHVEQILNGEKLMTRRIVKDDSPLHCKYQKYHTYAVQPGRGKKAVARIKILATPHKETRDKGYPIDPISAALEGGYTPQEYEALFEKMYPNWEQRWVIYFELVGSKEEKA